MTQASATKPPVPAQGGARPAATEPGAAGVYCDYLSPANFEFLSEFIQDYSGIKMPPSKKTMVEGRLRRRAAATGWGRCGVLRATCSNRAAWSTKPST